MSWDYSQEYACLSFDHAVPEEELRSMLAELSASILQQHISTGEGIWCAEEIAYCLREGELDLQGATEQLTDIAFLYLDQINHTDEGTELVVRSEYDSEYSDDDMAQEIAKHLFAKTKQSHFIWRSAAFDNHGAYSHQWIGFWENQKIELVHTDDYFEKQFAVLASA
jgi:hypothetical protein